MVIVSPGFRVSVVKLLKFLIRVLPEFAGRPPCSAKDASVSPGLTVCDGQQGGTAIQHTL